MSKILLEKVSRFYRWFKRPRTTIYIIAALAIIYLLGLLIPQKMFFKTRVEYVAWLDAVPGLFHFFDRIGFTDIYLSPISLVFLILFFLNLLAVTIERIPLLMRQAHIGKDRMSSFGIRDLSISARVRKLEIKRSGKFDALKAAADYLKDNHWFLLRNEKEGTILAVKNRFAVFGFLLFHLSFLLLLIGGLLIFYSRLTGYLVLTEGESFSGNIDQLRTIKRRPHIMQKLHIPPFSIEDVEFLYDGDRRSDLFIKLNIGSGQDRRREIAAINDPVRLGNVSLLANNAGVTPLFILRDAKDNRELDGAWISLNVLEGSMDTFVFQNYSNITYYAWFFPDYVKEDAYETSRTHEVKNPAFHIVAKDKDEVIAETTIKKGQSMVFGNYMLTFADLRSWGELLVVREVGPPFLMAGFALGIIGLIMRLIFYRREVRVAVDDDTLYLLGKGALNQISFEEKVDEVVQGLREKLLNNP